MSSLSEKLKALGVQVGARDLPPPCPRDPYSIQQVVPGSFRPTGHGEIFCSEQWYPLEYQQGEVSLDLAASLDVIAEWAGEPGIARLEPGGLAYLDTETTGLAGGTGTYVFLVGVGRYDDKGFHLAQFFMRDPGEEPALLMGLAQFLQPCRGLVTFNGKAFDVPLLNTRYIANAEAPPQAFGVNLDLLPLARRLWRDRLPSRALGYLEEHILGAMRTQEDVPGWVIPSLYFGYLRDGDARPLKGVFYHNAMDVLSLAVLLTHMAALLDSPLESRVMHALDLVAVGRLYEDLGRVDMAARLYEQGLAQRLPEEVHRDTLRRLSFLHKRRGNLLDALTLWHQAAGRGEIYAHVELAKYFEHTARDYTQAMSWTETAITLVQSPGFPRHAAWQWRPELEHRLARLRRKLGNS